MTYIPQLSNPVGAIVCVNKILSGYLWFKTFSNASYLGANNILCTLGGEIKSVAYTKFIGFCPVYSTTPDIGLLHIVTEKDVTTVRIDNNYSFPNKSGNVLAGGIVCRFSTIAYL